MDDLLDGMDEDELGYLEENDDRDLHEVAISMEDAWVVIDDYFKTNTLVNMQIDSFDSFIETTIQELVEDAGEIIVTPENQYIPGQNLAMVRRCSYGWSPRVVVQFLQYAAPVSQRIYANSLCLCMYMSFCLNMHSCNARLRIYESIH
jgi:hypothetical protein